MIKPMNSTAAVINQSNTINTPISESRVFSAFT